MPLGRKAFGSQPTYEELKRNLGSGRLAADRRVLSLPMRN